MDNGPPRFAHLPPSSSRIPHRPTPRVGQPPSNRNFGNSSAGGSTAGGGKELGEAQRNKIEKWGESYVVAEDSIRNDYSTHYVRTGERPQNHLRGVDVEERFSEYPKLASLLTHKHALLSSPAHSIPPTYVSDSPSTILPTLQPSRFDVILISPPPTVSFEELKALDLSRVAATPGFVWLWVGSGVPGDGVGLEKGRELIASWGYRRCEDIVWLKTNKTAPENDLTNECSTLFRPTIEHCLMGIRGTVRRSNDPWFVHCNVDTDVIVWEGDADDPQLKPPELHSLIENFCLGTRRLHLYGSPHSLRRGWLTVGSSFVPLAPDSGAQPIVRVVEGEATEWSAVEYAKEEYEGRWAKSGAVVQEREQMMDAEGEGVEVEKVATLLPFVEELDALRPKSPPPRNGLPSSGGLGRGRGAGLGVTRSSAVGGSNQRGPPPNRGPYAPYPHQHFQHQHQHQQPLQPYPAGSYNPAFFPPPNPYSVNPQFGFQPPPQQQFAPPFALQAQAPMFFPTPQMQAAMFSQWVAMGGAGMQGGGFGGGGGGQDQQGYQGQGR